MTIDGSGPLDQAGMLTAVKAANANVQTLMKALTDAGTGGAGNILAMMQLQMGMSALTQITEASNGIISGITTTSMSLARSLKG